MHGIAVLALSKFLTRKRLPISDGLLEKSEIELGELLMMEADSTIEQIYNFIPSLEKRLRSVVYE